MAMSRMRLLALALLGLATLPAAAMAQSTVDVVRARGHVLCGGSQGTVGFGAVDTRGEWQGLDVDTCRAVAARAGRCARWQVDVSARLLLKEAPHDRKAGEGIPRAPSFIFSSSAVPAAGSLGS